MKYQVSGPIDENTCKYCKKEMDARYDTPAEAHTALDKMKEYHVKEEIDHHCRCLVKGVSTGDMKGHRMFS